MEQLINMFYKDLVETLPFKDPIFQAHLKTAGLFPGDLKEIIEFKPSSAAMTAFFLDHGINNDKNNFLSLVRVMEEFNSKPVNNLASKIQKEIEQWHNKPGTLVLCARVMLFLFVITTLAECAKIKYQLYQTLILLLSCMHKHERQ